MLEHRCLAFVPFAAQVANAEARLDCCSHLSARAGTIASSTCARCRSFRVFRQRNCEYLTTTPHRPATCSWLQNGCSHISLGEHSSLLSSRRLLSLLPQHAPHTGVAPPSSLSLLTDCGSQCHDDSWKWPKASPLEQRLCMPNFRVPVVMVHMAGLRNGQWGRRGVMRALGVWHEEADSVSPAWCELAYLIIARSCSYSLGGAVTGFILRG